MNVKPGDDTRIFFTWQQTAAGQPRNAGLGGTITVPSRMQFKPDAPGGNIATVFVDYRANPNNPAPRIGWQTPWSPGQLRCTIDPNDPRTATCPFTGGDGERLQGSQIRLAVPVKVDANAPYGLYADSMADMTFRDGAGDYPVKGVASVGVGEYNTFDRIWRDTYQINQVKRGESTTAFFDFNRAYYQGQEQFTIGEGKGLPMVFKAPPGVKFANQPGSWQLLYRDSAEAEWAPWKLMNSCTVSENGREMSCTGPDLTTTQWLTEGYRFAANVTVDADAPLGEAWGSVDWGVEFTRMGGYTSNQKSKIVVVDSTENPETTNWRSLGKMKFQKQGDVFQLDYAAQRLRNTNWASVPGAAPTPAYTNSSSTWVLNAPQGTKFQDPQPAVPVLEGPGLSIGIWTTLPANTCTVSNGGSTLTCPVGIPRGWGTDGYGNGPASGIRPTLVVDQGAQPGYYVGEATWNQQITAPADRVGNASVMVTAGVQISDASLQYSSYSVTTGSKLPNGTQTHTITVTLRDDNNQPLSGRTDVEAIVPGIGGGQISKFTETSTPGVYTATVSSTEEGSKPVSVRLTASGTDIWLSSNGQNSNALFENPPVPDPTNQGTKYTVTEGGKTADGQDAHTITATLVDANGNPVSGADLSKLAGARDPADGVTIGTWTDNGDGTYTAPVTSTSAGSKAITVSFDGTQMRGDNN
ncbi:invasin domain 3-containing protein, partial [Acaricomes phytoseiuli]|uniref:invasin domain 3-containing protein n=1 Tax=Acaricomes phytoseiuli TaxID=291968 RepID=UPI001B7FD32F